ncbi:MAG: CDP-diacylglycerol--serine O-phosphatidyltransferase [Endomicrobium sp.]|jgi:CDP-diacylglycerol--serine O-phosphatidyltransferase|nr:CDP-diacylglycerol--serine O-phosphatidyltransferase [Endomicrobium sp.]
MENKFKKVIYIVPIILTCGNIICGYLSIVSSIGGNFHQASWLIILSLLFDMADGRIARMTKTTSDFGIYLDSLGDSISFGVAPAIMIYQIALKPMRILGLALSAIFVLCSLLRLAKFNIQAKNIVLNNMFAGLPTPAAAGVLISFALRYKFNNLTFKTIPLCMHNISIFFKIMPTIVLILSLLMISNIPYMSLKGIKLSNPKIFRLLILLIVIVLAMFAFLHNIIFIFFVLYAISGIVNYIIRYCKLFISRNKHENNNY